jgi:hypothetical protein
MMEYESMKHRLRTMLCVWLALVGGLAGPLLAKDKTPPVDSNDPTFRLFQALDNNRGGKLTDFYLIADVYKDPAGGSEEFQHILKADYDKNRAFGKLQIYVRSVGKILPDQLKTYTVKELYDFGLMDQAKYMKSEPGEFGRSGDIYLRAVEDRPLATTPVTDEVRKSYELFVTQHLLPAIEKK